jgi:hypothetical protein
MRKLVAVIGAAVFMVTVSSCGDGPTDVGPTPQPVITATIISPGASFNADTIAPMAVVRFVGRGTVDGVDVTDPAQLTWTANNVSFGSGREVDKGFAIGRHDVCLVVSTTNSKQSNKDCKAFTILSISKVVFKVSSADSLDDRLQNLEVSVKIGNTIYREHTDNSRLAQLETLDWRKAILAGVDSVLVKVDARAPYQRTHLPLLYKLSIREALEKRIDSRIMWPLEYVIPRGTYAGYKLRVKLHEELLAITTDNSIFGTMTGRGNDFTLTLTSWKKPIPVYITENGYPEWEELAWRIIQKFDGWFGEQMVRRINPAIDDTVYVGRVTVMPNIGNLGSGFGLAPEYWIKRGGASAGFFLGNTITGQSWFEVFEAHGWGALVHEFFHLMGFGHIPCVDPPMLMGRAKSGEEGCGNWSNAGYDQVRVHPIELGYAMLRDTAHRSALRAGAPLYFFDSLTGERVILLGVVVEGIENF